MTSVTIRFPMTPNNASLRPHWAIIKKVRRGAMIRTVAAMWESGVKEPFQKATLTAVLHHPKRTQDGGNKHQRIKPLVDGIVDACLIPDDSEKYLKWGEVDQVAYSKDPHIEVTITEGWE